MDAISALLTLAAALLRAEFHVLMASYRSDCIWRFCADSFGKIGWLMEVWYGDGFTREPWVGSQRLQKGVKNDSNIVHSLFCLPLIPVAAFCPLISNRSHSVRLCIIRATTLCILGTEGKISLVWILINREIDFLLRDLYPVSERNVRLNFIREEFACIISTIV